MRTFKLTINEDELKALISHHAYKMFGTDDNNDYNIETSARIHDLTKRLNKRNDEANDVEEQPTPTVKTEHPKIEGWN